MLMVNQLAGFGGGYSQRLVICDSADFDGSNDYMLRGAALTGVVDGKKGILSFWIRLDGGDDSLQFVFGAKAAVGNPVAVARDSSNVFGVSGNNSASVSILNIRTASTYVSSGTWRHILASWDLGTAGARHLYVNDVSDLSVTTFTNDTIDYAQASPDWSVGATAAAASKLNGCIAELYFNTVDYFDLSVTSNRRKFISDTLKPVYLGATGELPTNAAPAVYLHLDDGEAVANFATNRGTGGDFTITGTLDTGSTSPSD